MKNGAIIKRVISAGFLTLFAFEAANYWRLFHFSVDFTWIGLLITSLGVLLLLTGFDRWFKRHGADLHWSVWLLTLLLVGVDAFADFAHLYSRWSWFDQFDHFGGGFIGFIIFHSMAMVLKRTREWRHPRWFDAVAALGAVTILGNLYEIEEYFEDVISLTHRLGDGPDTANDLLMNLLGGLMALFLFFAAEWLRKKRLAKVSLELPQE